MTQPATSDNQIDLASAVATAQLFDVAPSAPSSNQLAPAAADRQPESLDANNVQVVAAHQLQAAPNVSDGRAEQAPAGEAGQSQPANANAQAEAAPNPPRADDQVAADAPYYQEVRAHAAVASEALQALLSLASAAAQGLAAIAGQASGGQALAGFQAYPAIAYPTLEDRGLTASTLPPRFRDSTFSTFRHGPQGDGFRQSTVHSTTRRIHAADDVHETGPCRTFLITSTTSKEVKTTEIKTDKNGKGAGDDDHKADKNAGRDNSRDNTGAADGRAEGGVNDRRGGSAPIATAQASAPAVTATQASAPAATPAQVDTTAATPAQVSAPAATPAQVSAPAVAAQVIAPAVAAQVSAPTVSTVQGPPARALLRPASDSHESLAGETSDGEYQPESSHGGTLSSDYSTIVGYVINGEFVEAEFSNGCLLPPSPSSPTDTSLPLSSILPSEEPAPALGSPFATPSSPARAIDPAEAARLEVARRVAVRRAALQHKSFRTAYFNAARSATSANDLAANSASDPPVEYIWVSSGSEAGAKCSTGDEVQFVDNPTQPVAASALAQPASGASNIPAPPATAAPSALTQPVFGASNIPAPPAAAVSSAIAQPVAGASNALAQPATSNSAAQPAAGPSLTMGRNRSAAETRVRRNKRPNLRGSAGGPLKRQKIYLSD